MSEKPYDINKMFNGEQKAEFIEYLSDNTGTQTTVAHLFYNSKTMEEQLEYDLCNFNKSEVGDLLGDMNSMTTSVVRTNARFIKSYITWAMQNGRRMNNIHPLDKVEPEWYDQFAFSKNLYLSEDDLENICNPKNLKNAQDEVIFRLLFEGAFGYKLSELTNLHYNDINWNNNEITLREKNKDGDTEERILKVSNKCINAIEKAYQQEVYYSKNGEADVRRAEMPLIRSDYIIRNTDNGRVKGDQADMHIVYRRLDTISKLFDLPYLTSKNIQKSGMIKMAVDLYNRDGELENKQLKEIAERFNVSKVTTNGYEVYNYSILRQFINKENILDLYGIEIEE